jgi:hypothetical protein
MKRLIPLIIFLVAPLLSVSAKNETVKEVIAKKSDYLNTEFKLKGVLHEPSEEMNQESYILVDRSNDSLEIRLRDQEDLEIGPEYKFEGKLKEKEEQLFFNVTDIKCLDCNKDNNEESKLLLILSAVVAILGVVIVYLIIRQKNNDLPPANNSFPNQANPSSFNPNPAASSPSRNVSVNSPPTGQNVSTDNFSTIAFNPNQLPKQTITESKTVVMNQPKEKSDDSIPGLFTVNISGKIEELSLKGQPSSLGKIVTIGREVMQGPKAKYHLSLKDQTVSRKQAELIYESDNLYIRNLSSTNPSLLNGVPLGSGVLNQVSPGSTMKFGEVILSYQN